MLSFLLYYYVTITTTQTNNKHYNHVTPHDHKQPLQPVFEESIAHKTQL